MSSAEEQQGDARIAVCDRASSYRRGLGAALANAGYRVEDPEAQWSEARVIGIDIVLLTVRTPTDWHVVRDMVSLNPHLKVVTLVVDATADRHAHALRCGAHGTVDWEATPDTILAVVAAVRHGMTLIPTEVARTIAVGQALWHDPESLNPEDLGLLRKLADGTTIRQLGEEIGYSERAMYRVLHGLYERMQVSNRTEAILQAQRSGLLDD